MLASRCILIRSQIHLQAQAALERCSESCQPGKALWSSTNRSRVYWRGSGSRRSIAYARAICESLVVDDKGLRGATRRHDQRCRLCRRPRRDGHRQRYRCLFTVRAPHGPVHRQGMSSLFRVLMADLYRLYPQQAGSWPVQARQNRRNLF